MEIKPGGTNGPAIATARRRRGWTQTQLGARAGIHASAVSRIERGEIQGLPATILAIAKALDVPIERITHEASASIG